MTVIIKIQQAVTRIVSETRNMPDTDIQKELIKQAPFHRGQIALWHQYGQEIFKQTGRKMFGLNYNDKDDPTIKRKARKLKVDV